MQAAITRFIKHSKKKTKNNPEYELCHCHPEFQTAGCLILLYSKDVNILPLQSPGNDLQRESG